METTHAELDFMAELTELSRKYGLIICGCGCCGSPSIDLAPESPELGFYVFDTEYQSQLIFVHPSDRCYWEKYGTKP